MQHTSLTLFLDGKLSAAEFWREIEPEVRDCLAACAQYGSGAVIVSDGPKTQISRQQVALLIAGIADGEMPMAAASYVADALIMSDDFAWEDSRISDALFRLADESAPLTMNDLKWAEGRLNSAL